MSAEKKLGIDITLVSVEGMNLKDKDTGKESMLYKCYTILPTGGVGYIYSQQEHIQGEVVTLQLASSNDGRLRLKIQQAPCMGRYLQSGLFPREQSRFWNGGGTSSVCMACPAYAVSGSLPYAGWHYLISATKYHSNSTFP